MSDELNQVREKIARLKADKAYARAMSPARFPGDLHVNKSLYFALCGDAVKIGVSSAPNVRVETLQTGAPGKMTLIAVISKAGNKESECHKRLDHLRINGEWFRYTEEVDQLIRELS